MADSPDDVRKRLAAKRAKLADAHEKRRAAELKGADELTTAHLLAEEARLDAELSSAQDAAKTENVQAGFASNLDAAKAAMAAYGGNSDVKLPADGSTLEKPLGITPEGETLIDQTGDPLPAAEKAAGAKGGAK